MKRLLAALAFILPLQAPVHAADIRSVSRIAFGLENVLFIADWKTAKIRAVTLQPASDKNDKTFNLLDLSAPIGKTIGAELFTVDDLAVRPGTGEAYVAITYGHDRKAAIMKVTADGKISELPLAAMTSTEAFISGPVQGNLAFWNQVPERSLTVTAMKWRDGELYVSGLSNQTFASTLWRIPYPFNGKQAATSIEIFHTSHDQIETRAPIRTLTFVNLDGKPYLLAAYLCTPLVTIPLDELKDGAHVRGKTIAELGYGNTPVNLVNYSLTDKGKTTDYVLVTNAQRNGEIVPLDSIAAATNKPGLDQLVPFGPIVGVDVVQSPLSGVVRIDNYNDEFFLGLRRDMDSGVVQLVTINKQANLRKTDFVSEYDFPSYAYPAGFQAEYVKPLQYKLMNEEGFKDIVR